MIFIWEVINTLLSSYKLVLMNFAMNSSKWRSIKVENKMLHTNILLWHSLFVLHHYQCLIYLFWYIYLSTIFFVRTNNSAYPLFQITIGYDLQFAVVSRNPLRDICLASRTRFPLFSLGGSAPSGSVARKNK